MGSTIIDIENTVIVDVEATPARTYDEVAATKTMIERTDKRLGLKPKRLAADTAYGTGKFLGWLIGAGITPHIPVWDKSTREDGTLSRSDFRWDKRRGVYICPNNKVLHTSAHSEAEHPKKISGASRRGSLPFRNDFAVCSFQCKDLKTLTISTSSLRQGGKARGQRLTEIGRI